MAPLIVHLTSFTLLALMRKKRLGGKGLALLSSKAEVSSIGFLFLITGVTHFTTPQPMVLMFPDPVPFKLELVYLSGFFEIVAGLLLINENKYQSTVGKMLIAFLVISLPLNIYSAIYGVGLGAKGLAYLWFRIPLQVFWGVWIWKFTIKKDN